MRIFKERELFAITTNSSLSLVSRLMAVVLISVVFSVAAHFPVNSYALMIGVVLLIALVFHNVFSSLLILPVLLATFHLAPWTGWMLVDEFDLFVLATVAVSLWGGHFANPQVPKRHKYLAWVLSALALIYAVAFIRGFFPLQVFDANALSTYYTNYLSLRLVKSFVWVLLLTPLLIHCHAASPHRTATYFMVGIAIGLAGVGLTVLWERGVFSDFLNATNEYAVFKNLLDFSGEHRSTALFSDMHTGGEAIDGYLALALPFAFVPLFGKQRSLAYGLFGLAFLLGLYSVLTTFTRATYLATFVSTALVLFMLMFTKSSHAKDRLSGNTPWIFLGVFGVTILVSLVFAYKGGGSLAIAGAMGGLVLGVLLAKLRERVSFIYIFLGVAAAIALSAYVVARAWWSSKWIDNTLFDSWLTGAALGSIFVLGGAILMKKTMNRLSFPATVSGVCILGAVVMILVPAATGYRMDTRFASSSEDLKTRVAHYSNVLQLVDRDWTSRLFGVGLGTFPKRYFLDVDKAGDVGSYRYVDHQGRVALQFGGGRDLGLGQRLSISPDQNYIISMDLHALEGDPQIEVYFCEKNLLYQQGDNVCVESSVRNIRSVNNPIVLTLNSGKIGQESWLSRWPTVFLIYNSQVGSLVEIERLSIRNSRGVEILSNGDFAKGGDRWYSYNDREHLQWHIKNFWLNIFFEMGALGVLVFGIVIVLAIRENWRRAKQGHNLSYALLAALVALQVQGLLGSMMDAPRILFLYLLIVAMSFLFTVRGEQ